MIGSRGIESEFGTSAIATFQDLVAKVMAHQTTGLGQKGPVPNKPAAALHITNIVRGSFGFLLEEMHPQQPILESALKLAVDQATGLLDAFGEPDEEGFQAAIERIDDRILATAGAFFEHMNANGATIKVVSGGHEFSFGAEAIARAAERARVTSVDEGEDLILGRLSGVLPDAHQFEFVPADCRTAIRGKVDPSWPTEQLPDLNKQWVGVDAEAVTSVKRVIRNGDVVRESFTLRGLRRRDDQQNVVQVPLVPA
ncbi:MULTISPECIES: hypothetical protein [unclassified Mesorhizobium]|uniref:hypothetical protein n=1 Tax=unclassified Mesorhizobium TaxID=325217 RepID=UPI000FE2F86E|nr:MULTISPECIES: hypothetical protein [unclassified Mesorhizobium]RWA98008.1 MAG: hypothetical protein EOQ33_29065 [Mesorhizobium sp.]RWC25221.1 MAG: hypothetical protein EOS51_00960 [Mesorhizobium sp.]RWE52544.1 MAG: hypothetical protein EOS67_30130 [Mesorhizobium sp.]RWE97005.1 MAG: hypothetical protein EOS68_16225 [Mesorhizobium sp.]RWN50451.1 MAG: hypothetical protein EOR98_31775 [Mesorhizobium sp.]